MNLIKGSFGLLWLMATGYLVAGVPTPTLASPIQYQVVLGVPVVNGFIETDGTLGTLTKDNITNWSLSLTSLGDSARLEGPLQPNPNSFLQFDFFPPTKIEATPEELILEGSLEGGQVDFKFFDETSIGSSWSINFSGGSSNPQRGPIIKELVVINDRTVVNREFPAAATVLAGAINTNSGIPEPGTAILFLTGVAGLAGYRWQQVRRQKE